MELKELQKAVVKNAQKYSKKHQIDIDEDFAMFKLMEEVGELSEAFLTYRKKSRPEKYVSDAKSKRDLAKELADVIGVALVLGNILNVDVEEAIEKKWITHEWIKDEK